MEDGCTAVRLRSNPLTQCALPGSKCGRRTSGTAKKLGHVIGVAFVAVGTKLALTVIVGISVGFSKMDFGGGFLYDTRSLLI